MRQLTKALTFLTLASIGISLVPSTSAQAAEVSLVSGLYRSEEMQIADVDAGKKTIIDVGGRFSDQLDTNMFWFGQGMLTLKSYEKGDTGPAPSDSTSLSLGGGVRYYFAKLSESISPYGSGIGQYKSTQDGTPTAGGTDESETNGLFYGASFGIRLSLGPDFFVDMETPLFESALFATTKTTHDTAPVAPAVGPNIKTEDESRKTELYVNTTGAFSTVVVAMGMRL